ncbi:aldehyde dehydrogenase family protein [Pseudomonas veronii]|uniref:aldehyde dehydrogenase family protein n=1 Tax=Pseudomonas veronii TaxID=76761 RepID=UPI0021C052B9|nr:aldehyde dehydrogenase family protein [Pseudomonas veronii]MCT9826622.1 aldehyde dehydrogenase family protein [Pseudomonas veronii]
MKNKLRSLFKFYIDGGWREPSSGRLQEIINPATEEVSGTVLLGDEEDVNLAIDAAHRAFSSYSQVPLEERIALIERIATIYERRIHEMAQAITLEMGAPFYTLSIPAQAAVGLMHLQVAVASAKAYSFETQIGSTRIVKEPVGVCVLITPWNWPMNQVICKLAPALITGCTVVLKPSQNAPYSSQLLAEILDEAGVPAGVFNMIQGEGGKLGRILSSHPKVDMVSLTGSTGAGTQVSQFAAQSIKRVSLELGGKSANIILKNANLVDAVTHGVTLMMSNSGQSCTAPSRMLVPRERLLEAEEIAANSCRKIIVGCPMAAETQMGPIANYKQYQKVRELIQRGIEEGAKLVCGGFDKIQDLPQGFYIAPTVFSVTSNTCTLAQEEIFGPVLVIIPYDDETHAVEIANDSIFGLSGYVYGADASDAERIARKLRTGMVHLNGAPTNPAAPFGGYKQSGNGREWGIAGIEEFLETKSIYTAIS